MGAFVKDSCEREWLYGGSTAGPCDCFACVQFSVAKTKGEWRGRDGVRGLPVGGLMRKSIGEGLGRFT